MTQPPWARAATPALLPTALQPPDHEPELEDAIATIARYDGDMQSAARELGMLDYQLLALIARKPEAPALISKYMRVHTLLHSYQLLDQVRGALRDKLDDMSAADTGKTYIGLLGAIAQLTTNQDPANININEAVMRQLPPEARVALKALMDGTADETIPDD